jgi:PAS domain S-box-containing protein
MKISKTLSNHSDIHIEDILKIFPDIIFIVDKKGKILDYKANSSVELFLPPEEFLDKKISDVLPPEVSSKIMSGLKASLKSGSVTSIEYKLKAKTKEGFYEARCLPFQKDKILFIIRDISDKLEDLRHLKISEQRFRSIWENSIDGMRLTDENGKIVEVNEAFCSLVEMERKDLIGKFFYSIYSYKTKAELDHAIKMFKQNFNKKGLKITFEQEVIFKNLKQINIESIHIRIDSDFKSESIEQPLLLSIFRNISERKSSEKALKNSESRFRNLVENINEVFHIQDYRTKNLLYVSPAYELVWGLPTKTLFKDPRSWKDIIHPDDRERVENILKEFSGKEYNIEYRIVPKDGKIKWIRDRVFPVKDEKGETFQIVGIAEDISAGKETETSLRESEERYRGLIETSPDSIILLDREGKITMSNRHVASLFGFDRSEETIGKSVFDFLTLQEKMRFRKHVFQIIKKGIVRNIEYSLLKKNGDTLPAEVSASVVWDRNGSPQAFLVVIRDISERKFTEEALKHSELQFRSVWENSNDGMRLTDSKGYIVAVNKSFCRLIGMSQNELIGRPFYEIYAKSRKKDPRVSLRLYQKRFINKNFSIRRRSRSTFKSGKTVDLDVSYSLIEFEKGNSVLLGLFRDITEQRKAEEELRNSEKLAAIGKMAAFLSHEIKTPLVSIKMNIDMLHRGLEIPDNKKRSFEIIQKEVKRLDRLLKNVLQYSRQVELVNGNINLIKLLENIKEFLDPILIERNIRLINRVEEIIFHGDYQKLQSVFLHLIENSVEAIGANGTIEVWSMEDNITDDAYILVKDSGCGIDEAENIFEPFYTTKSSGTGLGLSIAQKIIEQHEGKLRLQGSKKNETIFEIMLPQNRIKNGNNFSY